MVWGEVNFVTEKATLNKEHFTHFRVKGTDTTPIVSLTLYRIWMNP